MRTLRIAGGEPEQRAAALAAGSGSWLPGVLAVYDQLFVAAGRPPDRVRGWQSLATIGLRPAGRRMSVLAGGPCGRPDRQWRRFTAG